jgi:hypothetical protein
VSSTDLTTDDVRKLLAAWPAEPAMVFEETTQGMHVGVRGAFFYEIEPDGESGPSICIDEGEANLYDAAWSLAHKVIALTEENAALRTELTSPNAATRALDEIAAACGCPRWEYPGQVVRDVLRALAQVKP